MAPFTRQYLMKAQPLIAPVGGGAAGAIVAATFLLMPVGTLEDLVWKSGVAALIPVAEPPLGGTARTILALGGGLMVAAVMWSALYLLFGPGGFLAPKAAVVAEDGLPVLRKADAHPDAPVRRPLSAKDLGAPMPPVLPRAEPKPVAPPPVVQPIPADLDQPLAAFDPAAVPEVPLEPIRAVTPLRPPVALEKGERIATVELPHTPDNDTGPSIESLLRRLEQGTRQRVAAR